MDESFYPRINEAAWVTLEESYFIYRGFPASARREFFKQKQDAFLAKLDPLILRFFEGDDSKVKDVKSKIRRIFEKAEGEASSSPQPFDGKPTMTVVEPSEASSPEEEELMEKLRERFVRLLEETEDSFAELPEETGSQLIQAFVDKTLLEKSTELASQLGWSELKRGNVVLEIRIALDSAEDGYRSGS